MIRGGKGLPALLHTFIGELRRRRVLRVLAIYAVSAWVVLQIGEVTFGPLGVSDAVMRVLIVLALGGFPLAFVLAWLIEIGPRGLMFDLPLWPRNAPLQPRQRYTDLGLALGVMVLVGAGIYSAVGMLESPPALTVSQPADDKSIAVLAFDNFGGGEQSDFFASGLAEEILGMLAGISQLNVAARSSSFQFRGERIDVRKVARLLDVARVLEGSVRRDGQRLRVAVQLIDGETGFQSWRQVYDRDLSDVFAIQQEIASAIVSELKIALSLSEQDRLRQSPTGDLDAYLFYLQGLQRLRSSSDEAAMQAAVALFDSALDLDAGFARALAGRCEARLRLYEISSKRSQFDDAEADCERAAELDPGLNAEIHLALGRLYRMRGWFQRADAQLGKSLALAPSLPDVHIEIGELRKAEGRIAEAEASLLRAVDLKRSYWRAHEALASFYYGAERYAESVQAYSMVTSLAPDVATGFAGLGAARWMLGDAEAARAAWDRSLALQPSRQAYTNLGLRYYYAGRFDDAVSMQRKALEYAPDDHRVWGRLAESYRFLGGHQADSEGAYQRAVELAKARLEVNAEDWSTRGLLGLYLAHSKQLEEGVREVGRAVADSGRSPEALYYQALVRLRLGDRDGALEALSEALDKDPQYRQFVQTDPDLIALAGDPRFCRLSGGSNCG